MARFEVDSSEITMAAGRTRASAETIRAEVAAMVNHLSALQDTWRGGASAAFGSVLAQWRGTQQLVEQSLDSISLCLDAGSRHYEEAENATLQMFAR